MPSKARQKKIMEKLNRAQKCSILGPQNLGSGGGPGPQGPPWIRTCLDMVKMYLHTKNEVSMWSEVIEWTEGHMDRHTDRHDWKHYLATYAGGNYTTNQWTIVCPISASIGIIKEQ